MPHCCGTIGPGYVFFHLVDTFFSLSVLYSHHTIWFCIPNRCHNFNIAFTHSLEDHGWTVDTEIEHPLHTMGLPLEKLQGTEAENEECTTRQFQEIASEKRALILRNSHTGGHRYAGNCIVSLAFPYYVYHFFFRPNPIPSNSCFGWKCVPTCGSFVSPFSDIVRRTLFSSPTNLHLLSRFTRLKARVFGMDEYPRTKLNPLSLKRWKKGWSSHHCSEEE